jgi:hypothetical protein
MTPGHHFPRCLDCSRLVMVLPGETRKRRCPACCPEEWGIDPRVDPFEEEKR